MHSQLSAYQQLFKNFQQLPAILIAVILILALMILLNSLSEELRRKQFYRPYSSLPSLFRAKKIPPETGSEGGYIYFLSVRY